MEALVIRGGAVGVVLLFAMLWLERGVVAEATTRDILIFGGLALGAAGVLCAIVTANVILPTLAERSGDLADVLHAVAHGDLTREPSESGMLEGERAPAAARSALASLRSSIGEVRAASRDVAARAQELTMQCTTAVSVAQRGTESASSVSHQAALLLDQANAAHEDLGRISKGATRIVEEARAQRAREGKLRELSQESLIKLEAGTSALDELSAEVGSNAEELAALAGASEEIRSFVVLVRKMARQSKLLALNAAMEAARAGEQGSGFAVVASEVRRLARSSNEAADRTDQLVTDVLERVDRVRAMSGRAVDSVRRVHDATAGGLAALKTLERQATDAAATPLAQEDDVGTVTAVSDALTLRLEQLSKEAETLTQALKDAAAGATGQQARMQEIFAAVNALSRATTKAIGAANSFRIERTETPAPASAERDVRATRPATATA
jgi:methyl-accepting chemotaxis protein